MATNIEVKAILREREAVERRAAGLADGPPLLLKQRDTFFKTHRGRLKLRVENEEIGQLIYYERADEPGAKASHYEIFEIARARALESSLEAALGVRGRLVKERTLYLCGRTRIHLDRVEGLGDAMELEVVLDDSLDQAGGIAIAEELMARLGVPAEDRLEGAYMDLVEKNGQ